MYLEVVCGGERGIRSVIFTKLLFFFVYFKICMVDYAEITQMIFNWSFELFTSRLAAI